MILKVAISSAGRRCELIDCIRESAKNIGIDVELIALELNPSLSPACQTADKYFQVPRCTEDAFIDRILDIVKEEKISLIIPTIDTELNQYATNKERFAALDCFVSVFDSETINMCRDKFLTTLSLAQAGVPVPTTVRWNEFDPETFKFPVICKPKGGSSSVGIEAFKNKQEIQGKEFSEDYIVQELWEGKEFTVNCYLNRNGELITSVPHERLETRSGEVSKGITRKIDAFEEVAEKISTILQGKMGVFCFQVIQKEDAEFIVFEINARFGGGYPLAHASGAPFVEWLMRELLNKAIPTNVEWEENLAILRYDSSIFISAK